MSDAATFVLVHGAHAGGWWWGEVPGFLREAGHRVLTPTLTGLGERAHLAGPSVDLSTHVDDVANVLWYEDLSAVILVGMSYGGMVATGVADRMPERLAQLVYLDALVPRDGEAAVDLMPPDRRESYLARLAAGETAVPLGPEADPRLSPHPLSTFMQPIRLGGGGVALPRTFIRCTDPPHPVIVRSAERVLAAPGWRYREIACGHSAPRQRPREVADLLLEAVALGG
jgi:pimeloyl-ACP methyl ester carboxylesterase